MRLRTLFVALLLAAPAAHPQDVPVTPATPGDLATAPRTEPVLSALTRRDHNTLALKLAGDKPLLLHDFDFNGDPVSVDKLHIHELAPGVYELTSLAYTRGIWRFLLSDTASYYGLGAHFDTLDHAHTIVRNVAVDVSGSRGSTTPAPIPFFLSTSGYGLWLDPAGESPKLQATFDFNASDPANITVDATTTRLRLVLFTGDKNCSGQFSSILNAFSTIAPAQPMRIPFDFDNLPGTLTAVLSSSFSGQWFPDGVPMTPPEIPDPARLSRWIEFLAFTPGGSTFLPTGMPPFAVALQKRYSVFHNALANYFSLNKNIEPLALELQNETPVPEIKDEYMLGPDLLVAPALDQNPTRLVYLPAGAWHNIFTGEEFTGPATIVAPTPLDTIPVYGRPAFVLKLRPDASETAPETTGSSL